MLEKVEVINDYYRLNIDPRGDLSEYYRKLRLLELDKNPSKKQILNALSQLKIKEAVEILIEALKKDEGYRISWQANIAMVFKDEFSNFSDSKIGFISLDDVHVIANKASDNFLNLLCNQNKKEK